MGKKTITGDVEITGTLTNNGQAVGGGSGLYKHSFTIGERILWFVDSISTAHVPSISSEVPAAIFLLDGAQANLVIENALVAKMSFPADDEETGFALPTILPVIAIRPAAENLMIAVLGTSSEAIQVTSSQWTAITDTVTQL